MSIHWHIYLFPFLVLTSSAQYFSFAGYHWNQDYTPDRVEFLGNSDILGGAGFGIGVPNNVTRPVEFPSSWKDFKAKLSLGSEDPGRPGPRAINLPLYDDGANIRHGVAVYWSNNRVLPNLKGEDFVIYESGEGEGSSADKLGPELFMVRVRNAVTSQWTDWYHRGTDRFQVYGKRGFSGAFATAFELDDFGIKFGGLVDRIEIANMIRTDRIVGQQVPYRGKVIFSSEEVVGRIPRPVASYLASYESNLLYGPDLLYVASLHRTFNNPVKRDEGAYSPPDLKYDDAQALKEYYVLIQAIKGDVQILDNETNQFLGAQEVFANMRVTAGYSVVTGNNSAATLILPGGAALILQPGSLLSLDRQSLNPNNKDSGRFSIHLIRGSFLLGNTSDSGRSLPVSVFVGDSVLEGAGSGILYFQFGQPLQGFEIHDAGRIRKQFFELKTSLYSLPDVLEVADPDPDPDPGPDPGPDPDPDPEPPVVVDPDPEPEPEPDPLPKFTPPDVNPIDLPFTFSPNNLLLQGAGFLTNPVVPEGSESLFMDASGAPIDLNALRGLLIPGYSDDAFSVALQVLSGKVDFDGRLLLSADLMAATSGDAQLQAILSQIANSGVSARIILDDNGLPFLWVGDQQLVLPDSLKQVISQNPELVEYLDLSGTEGLELFRNNDGSIDFLVGENGMSILSLANNIPGLQTAQNTKGQLVFLPENGLGFEDILAPGVVGNSQMDQKVIKFPEGREGQLRRAQAQRIAKTNALVQAQLRKQQLAQSQASAASRAAQKRSQQQAAYAAKQAQQRAQQRAHLSHQYDVLKQKQQRAQKLAQQNAAKK